MGKDTIVQRLLERDPSLRLSRSWTTRPQRDGEAADAYTFVDRQAFLANVERDGFLEWAEYLGQLYGTPRPEVRDGPDVILVIEVQGAAQVLEAEPTARMILVLPPSREEQADRLRARGDSEKQVARRLEEAVHEEREGRRLAHHVVVNDDLNRVVEEVAGILTSYRTSP